MPTVPVYDNFQAQPTVAPDTQATAPTMPDVADQQLQQLGSGLENAGKAANDIYVGMQQQANQVRATDAENQLAAFKLDALYNPQTGFKNLTGAAAFQPDDSGMSPADLAQQQFAAKQQAIAASLGNDQQRAMFNHAAQTQALSYQQDLMQHQAEQYKTYQTSTFTGQQQLESQNIAANPNNPDAINTSLGKIKSAAYALGQIQGLAPLEIEAKVNVAASAALKNAFDTQIQNGNTNYAQAFVKVYGKDMTPDDALYAQGVLLKTQNAALALTTAQAVFKSGAPAVAQSPMAQMYAITAKTESGSRETNSDGSTVTSPKGAQGVMQVMPSTNIDPGYGVTPAQDNSPAERARVGRDYLTAMLSRYGNDPRLAWAAYNGGPGTLDSAIAQAKKTGVDPISLMPPETQKYVTKNMSMLTDGQGAAAAELNMPTKAAMVDQVTSKLQAVGANPETITAATTHVSQMYDMQQQAITQRKAQNLNAAFSWISQNPQTPVAQMPPAISAAVAPEDMGKVTDYAKKTFNGEDITQVPTLFQRGMVDDGYMKSLTIPQVSNLTAMMSTSDANAFTSRYHQVTTGKSPTDPGQLNVGLVNGVLNPMLVQANVNINPKATSSGTTPEQQQLAAIHNFVYPYLLDVQKANGKQLTQAQITTELNSLFVKNQAFRNTFMGVTTSHGTQPVLTSSVSDIPSDIKDALTKSLAAQGVNAPADGQILNQYFRLKLGHK